MALVETMGISYLKDNYSMSYSIAKQIYNGEIPPEKLYFDPRYWSSAEIREFFEDLQVIDNPVWEACVSKMNNRLPKTKSVETRIRKWKNEV